MTKDFFSNMHVLNIRYYDTVAADIVGTEFVLLYTVQVLPSKGSMVSKTSGGGKRLTRHRGEKKLPRG